MTSRFPTRSRWVRCCCIVSVSIASATIYWRLPRSEESDAIDLVSPSLSNEEADLAPTLANAREIDPMLNRTLTANATWNPEPHWDLAAQIIEPLPRPANTTTAATPIPETFPLQPRLKKEPPAIGDAIASNVNHQPQSPSQSLGSPVASPFDSKLSKATSPYEQVVHHELQVSTPSTKQLPAWPDQAFALNAAKASDTSKPSNTPAASSELATPHLLTGLEVRQKPSVSPSPTPVATPSSGFTVKPNQPRTSNYILQPMRSPPR
jgi:hypothetical protein